MFLYIPSPQRQSRFRLPYIGSQGTEPNFTNGACVCSRAKPFRLLYIGSRDAEPNFPNELGPRRGTKLPTRTGGANDSATNRPLAAAAWPLSFALH